VYLVSGGAPEHRTNTGVALGRVLRAWIHSACLGHSERTVRFEGVQTAFVGWLQRVCASERKLKPPVPPAFFPDEPLDVEQFTNALVAPADAVARIRAQVCAPNASGLLSAAQERGTGLRIAWCTLTEKHADGGFLSRALGTQETRKASAAEHE
jgi:hypothetical protein